MSSNLKSDIKVTLATPIELAGETITSVTIGPAKGKYMRMLPADPKLFNMGIMMDMAAKMTQQSAVVFDEMDSEDLMKILGIVGERLGAGQKTGEAS